MSDWEFFPPHLGPSGIPFSIAQVRERVLRRKRYENLRQTWSCSCGCSLFVPCPCPLSSHPHPLSPHNAAPFPLPSCSASTPCQSSDLSATPSSFVPVLTPLPSTPFVPFPSNLFWLTHRACPPKLETMCDGFRRRSRGEGVRDKGQKGHYRNVTVWVKTVSLGGLTSNKKPFTCLSAR